jgi:mycothiol synthase
VHLRELRAEDADSVVSLFRQAFGDARPLDAEEIRSWLRNEELRPEWLRVLEQEGTVVGYGDIAIEDDELAVDAAAPGHWHTVFDWAEREARRAGVARVRAYFPAGHQLATVVEARGYRLWRSSYTMEIELGDDPPASVPLPEGLALRVYRERLDEEAVRVAVNEAFAADPFFHPLSAAGFREFYLRARGYQPSLWLLAWDGPELVGVSLAYAERVGEPGLGWVGTLGVRQRWRRQGLGSALLRQSFRALHQRGLRRVGLGVDAKNATGALTLYERAGMHVERQGDNWTLDLRRETRVD